MFQAIRTLLFKPLLISIVVVFGIVCQNFTPSAFAKETSATSKKAKKPKSQKKAAPAQNPTASSKYGAIFIEAETGKVLFEDRADTLRHPASLTKMMTLYLAFAALKAGNLQLDQELTVSQHAASMQPSRLGLTAGDKVTVKECILAAAVKSANDCAALIAEAIDGSEEKFAQHMTARAQEMGLQAQFRNASGLTAQGHLASPRDMALLGRRLWIDFPEYYSLFSNKNGQWGTHAYHATNKLLTNYEGVDGIKTGYTVAAGFNIVASAVRDGHRVIGVIFGGPTGKTRDAMMREMLDKSFKMIAPPLQVATDEIIAANKSVQKTDLPSQTAWKTTTPNDRWGVQLGSFGSRQQAEKLLNQITQKHPELLTLASNSIDAAPTKNGTRAYRALLVGMNANQAQDTCKTLKSQKQDCTLISPAP